MKTINSSFLFLIILIGFYTGASATKIFEEDFSYGSDPSQWHDNFSSIWQKLSSNDSIEYSVATDQRLRIEYQTYDDDLDIQSLNYWHSNNFTITLDIQQNTGSAEAINEIWICRPIDCNGIINPDSGYSCMWYQTAAGADYFGIFKYIDGTATQLAWAQSSTDLLFNTYNTIKIDVEIVDSNSISIDLYMRKTSEIFSGSPQVLRAQATDSLNWPYINGLGMSFHTRNPPPNIAGNCYIDNILVEGDKEPLYGEFFYNPFDSAYPKWIKNIQDNDPYREFDDRIVWDSDNEMVGFLNTSYIRSNPYYSDLNIDVNSLGNGLQYDYCLGSTKGVAAYLYAFTQSKEELGYWIVAYETSGKGSFIVDDRLSIDEGAVYPTTWTTDPQLDTWYTFRIEPYNDTTNNISWITATVTRRNDNHLMGSIKLYDPNNITRLKSHKGMVIQAYPGDDKSQNAELGGIWVDNASGDFSKFEPVTPAQVWAEGFGIIYDTNKDCLIDGDEYDSMQADSNFDANSLLDFSLPPYSKEYDALFYDDFEFTYDMTKWQRVDSSSRVPIYGVENDKRLRVVHVEYGDWVDLHSKSKWHSNKFSIKLDIQQNYGSPNAETINQFWLFRPFDPNGNIDIDSGYYIEWYQTPSGVDYFDIRKSVDGISQSIKTSGSGNGTECMSYAVYNTILIDVEINGKDVSFDFYMRKTSELNSGDPQILRGTATDSSGDFLIVNGLGMRFQTRNPSPNISGTVYIDNITITGKPCSKYQYFFSDSFNYPTSPDDIWHETQYDGNIGTPEVPCSFAGTGTDCRYRVCFPTADEGAALGNYDSNLGNGSGVYLQSITNFDTNSFRVSADFQISASGTRGYYSDIWLFTPEDSIEKPDTGYVVRWFREGGISNLELSRYIDGTIYTIPNTTISLNNQILSNQYYTVTVYVDITDTSVDFDIYFNQKSEALGCMGKASGTDSTVNRLTENNGIGIGLFKHMGIGGISFVDNVKIEGVKEALTDYNPIRAFMPKMRLIRKDTEQVGVGIDSLDGALKYADQIIISIDSTVYGPIELDALNSFSFPSNSLIKGNHVAKYVFLKNGNVAQEIQDNFISINETPLEYDLGNMDFSKYYPTIYVNTSNVIDVARSNVQIYNHGARPESIKIDSVEILSEPVTYKYGNNSLTTESSAQIVDTNNNYVVLTGSSSCSSQISFNESTQVDYDGFIWFDVNATLASLNSSTLSIKIPLTLSGNVFYAYNYLTHDSTITEEPDGWGISMWDTEGLRDTISWSGELNQGDTTVPLTSAITISNNDRGLVIYMPPKPAGLNISNYDNMINISRNNSNITVSINLSDGIRNYQSTGLDFSFGLQPIPIRDYDNDYNMTHLRKLHMPAYYTIDFPNYSSMYLDNIVIHEQWTELESYYTTFEHMGELQKAIDDSHNMNIDFVTYVGFQLEDLAPESYMYLDYAMGWDDKYDKFERHIDPGTAYTVCYGNLWGDHVLRGIEKLIDEVGIDGLFMDGTLAIAPCQNEFHGHKTVDAAGRIVPYYSTLEVRRFSQLLYQIGQQSDPNFILDLHMSGKLLTPATMGLVTNCWLGEHVQYFDPTRKIAWDMQQAQFDGNLSGIPIEIIRDFSNESTYKRDIAAALQFNMVPRCVEDYGEWFDLTFDIWSIMWNYNLFADTFVPFYDSNSEITANNTAIKVGYYNTPDNVIIVLSNYDNTNNILTTVDMGQLALEVSNSGIDLLNDSNITIVNGAFETEVLGEDFKIIKFNKP